MVGKIDKALEDRVQIRITMICEWRMGASWLKSSRLFFDQVRQEAKRIVWPTYRDVVFTSIIVFIIAAMFSVFLFFVDQVVIAGLQVIL